MTHIRTTCSECSWLSYNIPWTLGKEHLHQVTILQLREVSRGSSPLCPTFRTGLCCAVFCFEIRNSPCRRSDHTVYKWQTGLRPEVSQLWPKNQIWFTASFSKKKKSYWKTSKAIHLHTVYGCFQWQSRVVPKKTTNPTKSQFLLSDSAKADPCLRLITLRILIQASVR